ncbi:kinase-like protein [Thelephora ganbajun]|uniref:Kinase-like protein n=1 Tax=Thelephora ganbajun TaxID=370292 RepID=A0ACB6Z489_THEGA|nr:kinase-like protein [Thelephora ganbajun]
MYDLYPGTYLGREVWCKKLSYGDPHGKAMMRFRREIDIWSKLWKKDQEKRRLEGTPPRVLPLYGFYTPYEGAVYLVNAKPERGTLREALRSGAPLDPMKIIKGIAQVLLLVHTMQPPIFHGDLNCTSIVIDEDWNPLLQDFRLSKTAYDVSGPTAVTHTIERHTPGGIEPVRWMAPETFNPRVGSTRSDIWSFGMVMYEILTKNDPYHECSMFTVIAKVANGVTPSRPETITNDKVWDLMKDCWMLKPSERPPIQDVIRRLGTL